MILSATLLVALYALAAEAALRHFNFTLHSAARSPDGFERQVYLINDQQPGPLIDVDEGDDLEIFVQNDLDVPITLHWHGLLQRGTPDMDGVPGVTQRPVLSGGNFTYQFSTGSQYGFYWYHSHFRTYYNDAVRGPLLIRPAASRKRPFESLATSDQDKAALLDAEQHAENVMLNDWTHDLSDVIYARYENTGAFPFCVDSILANGHGRVECLPKSVLESGLYVGNSDSLMGHMGHTPPSSPSSKMPHSSTTPDMPDMSDMPEMPHASHMPHSHMLRSPNMSDVPDMSDMPEMPNMPNMSVLTPRGCQPPMMFKPGFNASDLPPETCTNTTTPQLQITANTTTGWLALNFVNSGAVSALRVSLDQHSMYVYAADGLYIQPQKLQVLHMELGQRYSVMVKLDQTPGDYYLRFATYPSGDMQQVLEGQAIVSYSKRGGSVDKRPMDKGPIDKEPMDDADAWMLVNGSAKANASRLDPHTIVPFDKADWLPTTPVDKTLQFNINQTGILTWVMNDAPYSEAEVPILEGDKSPAWRAKTTLHLPLNATVDIILNIPSTSMDVMGHPLHLHGHKFWVLGSGDGSFPYASVAEAPEGVLNLSNPPYVDTTGIPPMGWTVLRYVADNPGAWMFHCHVQWHLVSGMAVVLMEDSDQIPGLGGGHNQTTVPGSKVTAVSGSGVTSSVLETGKIWWHFVLMTLVVF